LSAFWPCAFSLGRARGTARLAGAAAALQRLGGYADAQQHLEAALEAVLPPRR